MLCVILHCFGCTSLLTQALCVLCLCCTASRCYSVKVVSDAANLSLTLTTLAGTADIYVVELDKSSSDKSDTPKLPSPADPTSYDYTTHGQTGILQLEAVQICVPSCTM
jgi:hypothetical protein